MQKLYCYVDETGQDTEGLFFLISIVITGAEQRDDIATRLIALEEVSGKKYAKWHTTTFKKRLVYLHGILEINPLRDSLFYAVYHTTKEYLPLTSYTIAKTLANKMQTPYQAIIIIDGLNHRECERVTRDLRQFSIRCNKVRGVRDESDPFIRLADSIAGFLRDCEEQQLYTKKILAQFNARGFFKRTF